MDRLTANSAVSMGLDSLRSFSGTHDDDPSTNSTSSSTPLVVTFLFLTPEGRLVHPLDFGTASEVSLKSIISLMHVDVRP